MPIPNHKINILGSSNGRTLSFEGRNVGSIPTPRSKNTVLWCSGNTRGFDPLVLSSILGRITKNKYCPMVELANTLVFETSVPQGLVGSNPTRTAKLPFSVTVSTTLFDRVSMGSNPIKVSKQKL